MYARTTTKLVLAVAVSGLVPLGLAIPAQAATVVTHDGCTMTVDTPQFTNHFDLSGAKLFDYTYHVTCVPSAAGVTVKVTQKLFESDIVGRPGDPDAPDEFVRQATRNLTIPAAGATKNVTFRAVLPVGNDDTDVPLEMFQVNTFKVQSGLVTGTSSAEAISNSRALTP